MSKETYIAKSFSQAHRVMIQRAEIILDEYDKQGFILTLRQLYYQFVARDLLPNTVKSYQLLGKVIGAARLAGKIDWALMEDRTRNLRTLTHFNDASDALTKLSQWYHVDMWENQAFRPEVWVEKDALAGVIQGVCEENDVPWFSCRGYTSLSEMHAASKRLRRWMGDGSQTPYIIHLGDHDPSGIDMSRDIVDRLQKTFLSDCHFERVALNMDQIEQFHPPPNPAKTTDSRYKTYVAQFGDESWELDALEPSEFRRIIEAQLKGITNVERWNESVTRKGLVRNKLVNLAKDWGQIDQERKELVERQRQVLKLQGEMAELTKDRDKWKAKANHKNGRKGKP